MLIDREAILAAYGGQDVPAYAPATPGTGAYRADFTPYSNGDVAEAKKLLDAAGVSDGFDVECIFRITGQSAPTPPEAALIQQQLVAADITMEINPQDQTAFPAAVYGAPLEGKWGQNGLFGYTAFFGVRRSFASTSVPPGGLNSGAYTSEDLDELDRRIQASTSQEEYDSLWREANELISDDAPWAYLYHRTDIDALNQSVQGYAGAPDTYFDLRQVWKG
jgi:peptide/nickel transport system substrate-binding protein